MEKCQKESQKEKKSITAVKTDKIIIRDIF